jgi:hypothetical protein
MLEGDRPLPRRLAGRFLSCRWSCVVLTGLAFAGCLLLWASAERVTAWTHEDGILENATAIAFGLVALALAALTPREPRFFASSAVLAALMCARELNIEHAFTTHGVLDLPFYTRTTVPLIEKLIAGPIVLLIAIFVLDYIRRYGRRLWNGLRVRRAVAWTVVNVVFLILYSVAIDGLQRRLRDNFGIQLPEPFATPLLAVLEEGMELAIPLLIAWAILQGVATERRTPAANDQ